MQLNPLNPLAYAFYGRSRAYLGDYNQALKLTSYARKIAVAGPAPYLPIINVLNATTATLSGNFEEAIHLYEVAEASVPGFRPPLRSLAPLYLAMGQRDAARRAMERMRVYEPDFSFAKLRDTSYVNRTLTEAGLLSFTDADL